MVCFVVVAARTQRPAAPHSRAGDHPLEHTHTMKAVKKVDRNKEEEEGGRRKEKGGRRKEEGERRKEEGGERKLFPINYDQKKKTTVLMNDIPTSIIQK